MALPTLENVLDQWDLDSKMNNTEPGKELLRIPQLHAKYVRILHQHAAAKKVVERKLLEKTKEKWDYYSGKMDQEELEKLGLKPFKFVLKGEVGAYVAADKEILEITGKKDYHEEVSNLCSSILKELNSRTYQVRSFIDWERFIGGQ